MNPEVQNDTPSQVPPAPKTEDDLFKSANEGMDLEQAPEPQTLPTKKARSKKPLIVVLVLLLIATAVAAGWYFFLREKEQPVQQQQVTEEQIEEAALTYEPNTIAYAFREKTSDPVTVFTRPAAGGDRKQAQKLTRDSILSNSDTSGSNVVFVDGGSVVYASTDHGQTYTKIFEGEAGSQITDIILDNDGASVAFGYLKDGAKKNEVSTMDLKGENKKTLFTATEPGVIFLGWSSKKERMVYRLNECWNCDGGSMTPHVYDFKAQKATRILDDVSEGALASIAASGDTSKVVYVVGVIDDQSDGMGTALKAPYEVKVLDVAKNESTDIATVGKAGEKNNNGTTIYRQFLTGFNAGTNTPHYATGAQLFVIKDNEGLLFYESDKDLVDVLHVSDTSVIASAGDYNDYALTNYDVEAKKSTNILMGDGNTTLFGVTTD